jgi:hypothetical protein
LVIRIQNGNLSRQPPIEATSMPMRFPFQRRHETIRATLYSKADCHLCHEAESVVRRVFGARHVDVVDIIGDQRLEDEFIFRIPVLFVDGQVLAEGQITMADARLAHRAAVTNQRSGERT